jgi:hypothetical protein
MNVNVMNGISSPDTINGIGVDTSRKKDFSHAAWKIPLAPGRGAFLLLVKMNAWGLATVLNLAWARSQNFQGSVKTDWQNAWHNLGGSFQKLQSAVSAGRGKKAFAVKLAPQKIKNAYAKAVGKSIRGLNANTIAERDKYSGIADGGFTAAMAAAAPLVAALTPLILLAFGKGGDTLTNFEDPDLIDFDEVEDLPPPPPPEDGTKFGMDLKPIITVAAVALIGSQFLGKKKK